MTRAAVVMLLAFTLLTGLVYPLAVTGVAQLAFARQANGDRELIARAFDDPRDFFGRPSAAKYDAAASSGSNLGPTNPALVEAVKARAAALRALDPENATPIPVELVTASGSGLDPHISPSAAKYQVPRVARSRGLTVAQVQALVDELTEDRTFAVLGEPRVNVARLNRELDALQGTGAHGRAAATP